jgi:hypothetical protein
MNTMSALTSTDSGSDTVMDIFVASVMCNIWYHLIRSTTDKSEKQSAWILTLLSAMICVGGCIPTVQAGWDSRWASASIYADDAHCRSLITFFLCYLVWDTVYMQMHYRTIGGLMHHVPYFLFMAMSLYFHCPALFVIFFPLEISTIPLAIGYIWPLYRYDTLFGVSFFLVRIVLHIYLWCQLYHTRQDSPFVAYPWALLPWIMHIYWFMKWVRKTYFRKPKSKALPDPQMDLVSEGVQNTCLDAVKNNEDNKIVTEAATVHKKSN